jgi:hypothetical protein
MAEELFLAMMRFKQRGTLVELTDEWVRRRDAYRVVFPQS